MTCVVDICPASPAADVAGSVASLLAGGERLPTDQLPGAVKKRKVKHEKGCKPAFVRRVAGDHRKLAVHDLIRPVDSNRGCIVCAFAA